MSEKNKYDSQYDENKNPDTLYVSKKHDWNGRYVSFVNEEDKRMFVVDELINKTLYITDGGKEKIQATLLQTEDGKNKVPVLYISRINVKTGKIKSNGEHQICLYSEVIEKLYDFIGKIKSLDYSNPDKFKISLDELKKLEENPIKSSESYLGDFKKEFKLVCTFLKNFPKDQDILETLIDQGFNLEDLYLTAKIKKQQKDLEDFKNRLENANEFQEDKGENNWQDWFEDKKWLLGSENVVLMQRTINENFKTDFLTKYLDGFLNLIELKNPTIDNGKLFESITKERDGKKYNTYNPTKQLNNAIFQCIRYIRELEKNASNIDNSKKFENTPIIKPRATLIFGRSNNFQEEEWETLRLLNSHLNSINVITYDILLDRAKRTLSCEEKNNI